MYSNVTLACDDDVLDDTQAGVIVDNDKEKAILIDDDHDGANDDVVLEDT